MPDTPSPQDVFFKNQRKYRQQLRKRAIISLEQKKAICRYHVAHPKARHFMINDALGIDVERTTILKILKEKDKWLDLDSSGSAGKKAVRRAARFSKVNRAVAQWLQICHPGYLRHLFIWGPATSVHNTGLGSSTAGRKYEGEQDVNMELPSAKDVQAQAKIFAAMFPDETAFKASTGWLSSFRQNLSLAQFPAIASTLEPISETEPPLYRYIGQGTDPRLQPDPIKLSRYIYDQVLLSESGEQDFPMDPDILHKLSINNIHPPNEACRQLPMQDPALDISTSTLPLALRNEFGTNLAGMNSLPAMYLSSSPTLPDLEFSSGPSFEMQNFETQSQSLPRPEASRLSISLARTRSETSTSHLHAVIQGPTSFGLPSASSPSLSPGSPMAMDIGDLGLPLQEHFQPVSRMAIQSPALSSFHPAPVAQPSREQVYGAMTTLMAWMSHDPDAVSVVGSDNTFYLALSQVRMRLLQQQQQRPQQEQQRH
ncbi:hypothetical protein BG003_004518 [Podila horticola]|nr:hypothetical protein BG003_004518 [Podila horticola]